MRAIPEFKYPKKQELDKQRLAKSLASLSKKRVKNELEKEMQGLGMLYEKGMRGQWLLNRFYDLKEEMK